VATYKLTAEDLDELELSAREVQEASANEVHDTENCPECRLEDACTWAELGW